MAEDFTEDERDLIYAYRHLSPKMQGTLLHWTREFAATPARDPAAPLTAMTSRRHSDPPVFDSAEAIADARRAVKAGAGHECAEWTRDGRCLVCDKALSP